LKWQNQNLSKLKCWFRFWFFSPYGKAQKPSLGSFSRSVFLVFVQPYGLLFLFQPTLGFSQIAETQVVLETRGNQPKNFRLERGRLA
jgi:hypothetical protein